LCAGAAACGSGGSAPAGGGPGSGSSATAAGSAAASGAAASSGASARISLAVTVTGRPGITARHWTLRCDPAGGTSADPAAACRVLMAAGPGVFGPLRRGIMCPMIVIGTSRAKVTGSWDGRKIDATLYDGGCYLQRWAKVGQIFH